MELNEKLIDVRKKLKLTQKQFAAKVGIGTATLQRYESGERSPNIETLRKITTALSIELSDLIPVDYPFKDNNLAKYREEMNLTAEELAEKIDMKKDQYMRYETGELPMLTEYWDEIEVLYKEITGKELETQYNRPSFEKPSREADLLHHFNKLNEPGQDKAVESVELLTKIPEYKK